MVKKIILGCVIVLAAAQFVRPAKNADLHPSDDDIFVAHPAPPGVRAVIQKACYDCHSQSTRYPWYAEIQPVGWWLAKHVRDGKAELNFSTFGRYSPQRAARKLDQCDDELDDDTMPLKSYRWIHADARLTPEQKKQLEAWFDAVREQIQPSSKGSS